MSRCPSCMQPTTAEDRSCPSCGSALGAAADPTLGSETPPPSSRPPSRPRGRFEAGSMLGGRYRIVGLLGRGGMGEVYRADDLELGQSVALKFLPERLSGDEAALERFRREVRTAREVAHPNVCRTYDIGNAEGHVFLSMEFVDGEDLASALRRMGRPSVDKAIEIARQICLGLAAAHENGVLHRDLKPANVMIDGRGRVRITDFGLAGLIEEMGEEGSHGGTPAYMAPEQLAHGKASVRSDVYALGLVLHELFTGRRVFATDDPVELRELQSSPSSFSTTTASGALDPAIERLVARCIEKDPQRRPPSVYAVLGALPGGDPIAAALAAGETPSPDLVAAAGDVGGLSPRVALACLVVAAALVLVNVGLAPRVGLYGRVVLDRAPAELAVRARDVVEELGHPWDAPVHAQGFRHRQAYLDHLERASRAPDRWAPLAESRPEAVRFWYRWSREPMDPAEPHQTGVGWDAPPLARGGSGRIELDPQGRLLALTVVLDRAEGTTPAGEAPGLDLLFERAGLDRARFRSRALVLEPPVACEAVAFESDEAGAGAGPLVVQAGMRAGRIVYFETIWPWDLSQDRVEGDGKGGPFLAALSIIVLLGVVTLAYRNVSLGRSDRSGAFRVGLGITAAMTIGAALADLHPLRNPGHAIFAVTSGKVLAHALLHGAVVWLLYVALEPHARRHWPRTLVSWTRLLMGRFRDPQLGRDTLVGGLLAGAFGLIWNLTPAVHALLGQPPPPPDPAHALVGAADQLGRLLVSAAALVTPPMLSLVLLVLLRVLIRRPAWVIAAACALGMGAVAATQLAQADAPAGWAVVLALVPPLAVMALGLVVLLRFGLWATAVGAIVSGWLSGAPLTLDFSRWHAGPALVPVAASLALLAFGFWTALAGRPLFRDELAEG